MTAIFEPMEAYVCIALSNSLVLFLFMTNTDKTLNLKEVNMLEGRSRETASTFALILQLQMYITLLNCHQLTVFNNCTAFHELKDPIN